MVIVLCHFRHCFVCPKQRQKLEDGGDRRRAVSGLGLLRRDTPLPGDRLFPRLGGGTRTPPPQAHSGIPGIRPAPGIHRRSGAGAASQGQAQGGARRALRPGALLQLRRFRRVGPHPRRSCAGGGWAARPRHHPPQAPRSLPGRGAPRPAALGWGSLRDRPLAQRQGASGPSHPVFAGPLPAGPAVQTMVFRYCNI